MNHLLQVRQFIRAHKLKFAACIALLFASTLFAVGGLPLKSGTSVPRDSKLSVELSLSSTNAAAVSPALAIKNAGSDALLVQQPTNRQAIVFLVTDAMGNVVAPVMRGKADPGFDESELRPGADLKHTFDNLDFVTGSAWMGYDLKRGQTYHVVALYRPSGIAGPGFCSHEETVTVK
jgi:hypothetical protein